MLWQWTLARPPARRHAGEIQSSCANSTLTLLLAEAGLLGHKPHPLQKSNRLLYTRYSTLAASKPIYSTLLYLYPLPSPAPCPITTRPPLPRHLHRRPSTTIRPPPLDLSIVNVLFSPALHSVQASSLYTSPHIHLHFAATAY